MCSHIIVRSYIGATHIARSTPKDRWVILMTHPRQVMFPCQWRARQRRMVTIGRLLVLCAGDAAALGNGIANIARCAVTQKNI